MIEVLTAFIREHSWEPWPLPRTEEEENADLVEFTRPDVQAALTVVGRRNPKYDHDRGSIDLIRADLTRADLTSAHLNGADLRWACLVGAHLNGADLRGADLSGADLTGAHLNGADLRQADLTGAYLPGTELLSADLTGANFTDATITGTHGLATADLTDANLAGARWPEGTPVPEGWERDADGRLQRAGNGSGAG